MLVKIFKEWRDHERWLPVIHGLQDKGYEIYGDPVPVDHAIILGAQLENPLAFKCPRTAVIHVDEWYPPPYGYYRFYGPIVKEYYDEILDVSDCNLDETINKIEEHIKNVRQKRQIN